METRVSLRYFVSYCGVTYSACILFTENKERIEKYMQTGNTDYIYKNDLDKVCFEHEMVYGKYKDLNKRTQSIFGNIWSVDLADMQLTSKYKKGVRYFLCTIDLFSKYTWVVPLKD